MTTRTPLFARQQPGGLFTIEDVPDHPASIFFVDSTHAQATDAAGGGRSPDKPLATLDYAVGLCTASKGDVIYVMPGHAEAISAAAGLDLDKEGITIIGLGNGDNKPTFTLQTSASADVDIDADNITIKGLRFVSAVASLLAAIDINSEHTVIEDCEFIGAATFDVHNWLNMATTKDYLTVRRSLFTNATDPAGSDGGANTGCLYVVDSEHIYFEDCHFYGNFETAIFHNKTTACKDFWVKNCTGVQLLSGAEPFQLVNGADGAMLGGGFITPAETGATEASLVGTLGAKFFILAPGNFGNDGAAGGQGGIIIATAS
jgi:hypothetical protein